MKKKIKYIDGDRVTITNEPCDLEDELPEEIDFSTLKEIPNPIKSMIMLDPDVSRFFRTSKQVNNFLRKQIRMMRV